MYNNGLNNSVHDRFQWTCFYSVLPNHKLNYSNKTENRGEKSDNLTEKSVVEEGKTTDIEKRAVEIKEVSEKSNGPKVDVTLANYATQESSVLEEKKVAAELEGKILESRESIFKRFKAAYKEHGKTLLAVHCATSVVWLGSFYYAAHW
jgi:hypothetical protein